MQEAPVGSLVRKLRSHMLWDVTKRIFFLVKVVNVMFYHHKQKNFLEWKREAEEENQRKEKRKKTKRRVARVPGELPRPHSPSIGGRASGARGWLC